MPLKCQRRGTKLGQTAPVRPKRRSYGNNVDVRKLTGTMLIDLKDIDRDLQENGPRVCSKITD